MSLLDGNQEEQGNPVHSNGDWLIESKTEFLRQGVINIQWCEVEWASNKKECEMSEVNNSVHDLFEFCRW